MRPPSRTPQQRDRRLIRVRRLTQTVFVGAGAVSAVLVGYVAANAKPLTTTSVTTPTTATTLVPTSSSTDDSSTPSATVPATVPTTAPATSTTVCTTSPSGTVTCY
jgi:hypothetical protein